MTARRAYRASGDRRGRAAQLAATSPEVSWQGRRVRVFLPASRLYGARYGGAVALLSPEAAQELAASIIAALTSPPPSARRELPEVLRGVER